MDKMIMDRDSLKGAYTAIVTPFAPGAGEPDLESLRKLIEHQISAGVAGVVACGSTGEASTLSDEEYREVVGASVRATRGKVACLAGIGVSSTARAAAIARSVEELGADAILLCSPPYNKPTQEGLLAHFGEVRKATRLPIVAYNIPGRTAVAMAPATIARLAEDGVIIGLKDATGSIDQLMDLMLSSRGKLSVLSGEDSLVHAVMASGGRGVISACANIAPRLFVRLCAAALAGNLDEALVLQLRLIPLVRAMFMETNPIPVKAALAHRKIIACADARLPLTPAATATLERMAALLADSGIA